MSPASSLEATGTTSAKYTQWCGTGQTQLWIAALDLHSLMVTQKRPVMLWEQGDRPYIQSRPASHIPILLFACVLILALRIMCMEDMCSGSLWNDLSGAPKSSTETSGLQADRETPPLWGFSVREKPHGDCGAWKSGCDFHKSINHQAQYCCQGKKRSVLPHNWTLILNFLTFS